MKLITPNTVFDAAGAAVAIGMFDGLHKGHRSVLTQLRTTADRAGLPSVVVTFDPHPRAILREGNGPLMLASLGVRVALLAATGLVDYCFVLSFDKTLARQTAEDFVEESLITRLHMRKLVVGGNFCCGAGRRGNLEFLGAMGALRGFDVTAVALSSVAHGDEAPCSSTLIRGLIRQGNIASAQNALGRPHAVDATVLDCNRAAMRVEFKQGLCIPEGGSYVAAILNQNEPLPGMGCEAGHRCGLAHLIGNRIADVHLQPRNGHTHARPGQRVRIAFLSAIAADPDAHDAQQQFEMNALTTPSCQASAAAGRRVPQLAEL